MARVFFIVIVSMQLETQAVLANGPGLFDGAAPLFQTRAVVPGGASPSLFAAPSDGGFFAPLPDRPAPAPQIRGSVADLLSLIAEAEAGVAGYDAVNGGARIRPPRPPTHNTH